LMCSHLWIGSAGLIEPATKRSPRVDRNQQPVGIACSGRMSMDWEAGQPHPADHSCNDRGPSACSSSTSASTRRAHLAPSNTSGPPSHHRTIKAKALFAEAIAPRRSEAALRASPNGIGYRNSWRAIPVACGLELSQAWPSSLSPLRTVNPAPTAPGSPGGTCCCQQCASRQPVPLNKKASSISSAIRPPAFQTHRSILAAGGSSSLPCRSTINCSMVTERSGHLAQWSFVAVKVR